MQEVLYRRYCTGGTVHTCILQPTDTGWQTADGAVALCIVRNGDETEKRLT